MFFSISTIPVAAGAALGAYVTYQLTKWERKIYYFDYEKLYKDNISEAQRQSSALESKLVTLGEQHTDLESKIIALEKENYYLGRRVITLEKDRSDLEEKHDEHIKHTRMAIHNYKEELAKLSMQVEGSQRMVSDFQERLEKSIKENNSYLSILELLKEINIITLKIESTPTREGIGLLLKKIWEANNLLLFLHKEKIIIPTEFCSRNQKRIRKREKSTSHKNNYEVNTDPIVECSSCFKKYKIKLNQPFISLCEECR